LDRPRVVGALWNGKDKRPSKNPGGNPRRVIKSRLGNKITFDDDKEQLIIEDGVQKGKITIDAKANKITIEAIDGDVCFQTPKDDMTIVAKSIQLTAKTNLEVHSVAAMAWGAGASASIMRSSTARAASHAHTHSGSPQLPTA